MREGDQWTNTRDRKEAINHLRLRFFEHVTDCHRQMRGLV